VVELTDSKVAMTGLLLRHAWIIASALISPPGFVFEDFGAVPRYAESLLELRGTHS